MQIIKMLFVCVAWFIAWSIVAGCGNQSDVIVDASVGDSEPANVEKANKETPAPLPLEEPASPAAKPAETELAETEPAEAESIESATFTPEQLVTFAFDGNLTKLVIAMEQGVDVNQVDQAGNWPLSFAAYQGHDRVVEFLLKQGADVSVRDSNGRTALMYAATLDQPKTLKLLLDAGAEVNVVDSGEGWTPWTFAAGEGHVQIMKMLIERGAKLDVVDSDGDTALTFAVRNNHVEAAKLLQQ